MEEIKVTTEMVDNTAKVAEEITESVVEKAGMSLGTKAGIVGGVLVAGVVIYGAVKYFKDKKAKDAGEEAPEVVEADEVEAESEETTK